MDRWTDGRTYRQADRKAGRQADNSYCKHFSESNHQGDYQGVNQSAESAEGLVYKQIVQDVNILGWLLDLLKIKF